MAQWCRATEEGVLIRVKVVPRSSKPGLQGVEGDCVKVRLKSPPVEGKANQELVSLLAKLLRVPKSRVEIVKGHKARTKEVMVTGLELEEVEALV